MSELQPQRGLSTRAFLIGLALVMVWIFYICTLAVDNMLCRIEVLYLIGFAAVFTMFAVVAVNNALKASARLSRQELTVIYTMVAVAVPWGILVRAALEAPMRILILYTSTSDESVGWLTRLWVGRSYDAKDMFAAGGKWPWEIPWRFWWTPILYWSGILISFQSFAIFLVLFFRRLFIDEEKLPFPLATVGQSIIEYVPPKGEDTGKRRLATAVKVAFVVGLLFCLPGIVGITPDSQKPIPMNPGYYGTKTGLIRGLDVTLSWDPFIICFLMFFPLDVLFTVTLCYVGLNIVVPAVCLWAGVPTPAVGNYTLNILGMGGLVGLAFWTVFFNRRLIWRQIKRALAGGRDPDTDEPISMRLVLVGLALSFIAFVTLFVLGLFDLDKPFRESDFYLNLDRHLISLALVMFMLVTMLIAIMRQSGEAGWYYHSPWSVGKVMAYTHHHYLDTPKSLFQTQASFLTLSHLIHFGAYHNTFGPHLHVLNALKVANQTKTRTRDVMTVAVVTLLIVMAVVIPGYLIAIHYYGFNHGFTRNPWWNFWNYAEPQHGIAYTAVPSIFNRIAPWVSIPIGVTIIGVVMYFRRERVGFPLSPVGVVISAAGTWFRSYSTSVIWLPVLIVLVLKRVIYRWFGVAFFRRRVIPVVIFLMMGLMTGMFIYKIIFLALGRGIMRPY